MANVDTGNWDKAITELRNNIPQQFQNPQTRDIAQHCLAMLTTLITVERNYGTATGTKEAYQEKR